MTVATAAATAAETAAVTQAATAADSSAAITQAQSATGSSAALTAALSVAAPPEKYDLKVPATGAFLDPAFVERTAAHARALGLSNEGGQRYLDSLVAEIVAFQPGGAEWTRQNVANKAAALAHPDLGNGSEQKLAEVTTLAQQALTKWFPEIPDAFLKATGLASKPELLIGLARLARAGSESPLILGGQQTGGGKVPLHETLYGKDGMGLKKQE